MASLNKLAIRGIRSFDDKHVQVIEFYSPLTVIVGHNGSGKTTIIECLKYATTGDLPPNTKGGAFIHDPKMANEKEVKAQVRLRFWNVNRQRMTATRSLQVTMKKGGGLTMKTLEGLLAKTDPDGGEGKRNTISTKCADMDEEIPLLLGVSKAILENVIFCHQEESNWPLSEPAALKKKFDDIFEATKYTKALDNIKLLRKERTAELKVDKERLKFLKQDKDKAERMRKELQDHIRLENTKTTEAEQLKEQHTRLKQLNMEHYEKASTFQRTFEKLDRLKAQKNMLQGNSESLLQGMTIMEESTEELRHMRDNFNSHLAKIAAKKDKQIELREKEDSALDDLRRKERNLASVQGGLLANKRNYERNLKEREAAVREVAKNHNFAGYDYSPLEDSKIVEFVDKLHDLVRKADADLKKLQADGQRKERELQAELDRLAGIKTSAVATRRSKQDQITQLNARIRIAESNFESVSTVDTDIAVTEDKISNSSTQLQKLEDDIKEARYDEQIRERTFTIRQREADRDKANGELGALNRQADSRAQLTIKRNEITTKKGSVDAMVESHRARYAELVGGDLVAEKMEETITLAVGRKDRELQDAETSASAANRQFSQLQASVNIAKQSLKAKSDEISRMEKAVRDALTTFTCDTVDEAITEAVAEVELRQSEVANAHSMKALWENILKTGRTKKKCYGCDRELHDNEGPSFETYYAKKVKARIAKCSSSGIQELRNEAAQWEAELANLRRVAATENTIKDLRENVIPELEKQVADESAQLEVLQDQVEETKEKVQRAKLAARDLQTLKGAAALLSRTLSEIKDLSVDIKRLERDLESSGSLKTVDEVQKEVDTINDTIKTLQREQTTLSSDKELKQNMLRGISDDINKYTLKLGELKSQRDKQRLAEEALRELRENLTQLQADLKDLETSAQAAEGPWREKNDALNRYRNERQNAENEASLQVGIYQSSIGEIESKHRACQSYISEGNDRKIRDNEAQIDDLKREISSANEARVNIDATIQTLQSEEATAGNLKTNIASNLNYREQLRAISKVQEELDGIDVEAAAKARREFETKYAAKVEEENTVHSKWQLRNGELVQMAENRKKLNATLQTDYKDIDQKFMEQLVKTKTSELANNDLEKYGKALDNAILKYHAIKMDEINDTIGHLWNKTYQGTDIDGIKIVSDNDETGTTTTRKSYNYRVVMLKNEVELDMRGRCSAGQKVLASIIIRLALAESFGQGCGVLALDEPTTNLDQENINALAEALAEIIRERRRQANFQLIVITHDEGFLQRLAGHDVLEYYWRVSRDASQKSVLERQRIAI